MSADRAHACPQHPPGTYSCYSRHACRCDDCTSAAARYSKRRRHLTAVGQPTSVDAEPIRRHLASLIDSGMAVAEIERRSGYNRVGVRHIIRGDYTRVSVKTAARLALVEPVPIEQHVVGHVDPTGTRRRIQALVACGWTLAEIERHTGVRRRTLSRALTHDIFAATRTAVAVAYEALWDQPTPAETARDRQNRGRSLAKARIEGWLPPLAWDDDTIDRPDAKPYRGRRDGWPELGEVQWLLDSGESTHQIARRMGCKSPEYLAVRLRRHGEHELADIIIGKVA